MFTFLRRAFTSKSAPDAVAEFGEAIVGFYQFVAMVKWLAKANPFEGVIARRELLKLVIIPIASKYSSEEARIQGISNLRIPASPERTPK